MIAVRSLLLEECLGAIWGLFLLALVITPILIFSRLRERQPGVFFATSALAVTTLVGTWFSPLLWDRWDLDFAQPFHYSGYRVLAFAIVFTVIAIVVRGVRPNHPVPKIR
jgi:hypothetical protein